MKPGPTLLISEYHIEDGVLELRGTAAIEGNGAAPKPVTIAVTLVSIKILYHSGAMVHMILEKDLSQDIQFEEEALAKDFYTEFYNELQEFYAEEVDGDLGGASAPGSGAVGDN
jgi:hypothetical protein